MRFPRRKPMIYYVKTGQVDTSIEARNHRQAAVKALRNRDEKEFAVCVMVNEQISEDGVLDESVFFLTQNILDECAMKVVN